MFAVTALISMMEDLSEGSHGRDPQKKKCQWCPYVYSTTYLTPEAKRLLGRNRIKSRKGDLKWQKK